MLPSRPCQKCHYPVPTMLKRTGRPAPEPECPNPLCPQRPVCPRCGSAKVHRPVEGGVVECRTCKRLFHAVEQSLKDASPARLRQLLQQALTRP